MIAGVWFCSSMDHTPHTHTMDERRARKEGTTTTTTTTSDQLVVVAARESIPVESRSRKRLSRKEQKARKKQKKHSQQQPSQQQQQQQQSNPWDGDQHYQEDERNNSTQSITFNKRTKKKKNREKNSKENNSARAAPQQQHSTAQQEQPSQDSLSSSIFDDDSYVPTPIPSWKDLEKLHGAKPLGKWFPKAVVIKSRKPPPPTASSSSSPSSSCKASLLLFYQYVEPQWTEQVTQQLMSYLCQIAKNHRILGGRIRVAREGVNATISSRDDEEPCGDNNDDNDKKDPTTTTTTTTRAGTSAASTTLRHFVRDLQSFHDIFQQTDFKYIDNLSGDRHFKDFKIFPVKELVDYGLDNVSAPLNEGGIHLSAQEFHSKLEEQNTVVVDVRNHYEAAIGRFDGQTRTTTKRNTNSLPPDTEEEKTPLDERKQAMDDGTTRAEGAVYVDPKMRKSTDFATWLQKNETKQQLVGKQVLLYCTGGVRCERASAHLNQCMGNQLSGVYQLQGGIERYLQAFPDGGYWRGKNFVFDKREAIDVDNPDGDGGVVVGADKNKSKCNKKKKKTNTTMETNDDDKKEMSLPEMKCCVCDKPWNRYVGKKKCSTCGVPVLMCNVCMTNDTTTQNNEQVHATKKDSQQEKVHTNLIRCPLCVEENVTVRAEEVDWTNNGMTVRCSLSSNTTESRSSSSTTTTKEETQQVTATGMMTWCSSSSSSSKKNLTAAAVHPRKVASSVLKWGGGYALGKKERRRRQGKPCKFGTACKRSHCFFVHPELS